MDIIVEIRDSFTDATYYRVVVHDEVVADHLVALAHERGLVAVRPRMSTPDAAEAFLRPASAVRGDLMNDTLPPCCEDTAASYEAEHEALIARLASDGDFDHWLRLQHLDRRDGGSRTRDAIARFLLPQADDASKEAAFQGALDELHDELEAEKNAEERRP